MLPWRLHSPSRTRVASISPSSPFSILLTLLHASLSTVSSPPPSSASARLPLASLLAACKSMKELEQIHSLIIRAGLAGSPHEQRRLLSTCCSLGSGGMAYARLLLDEIPSPADPFLWNCLIRGHSDCGAPRAAVSVYVEMLASGASPNGHTFPFLLKGFSRDKGAECGDELHAHVVKLGFDSNSHVRNALLSMYAASGDIGAARELFDSSPARDAVLWNSMISGCNRNSMFEESCRLFVAMAREKVTPTSITYILVLSACGKMEDLDWGRQIHQCIMDDNLLPELRLQNALIEMYGQCGDMEAACRMFEEMQVRDVISWTAIVVGFAKSGEVDQARSYFDRMPERDLISWTAMIYGYVHANHFKEALEIFGAMQLAAVKPDEFTMVSLLTACAHLGALEVGEWIRTYMERNRINMDIVVGNALIDMYSKCGRVESAVDIFQRMHKRDKFTWTAMISGMAMNGHGKDALDLFYKMVEAAVRPDEVTYIGALTACAHAGLIKEGRELFSSMTTAHGIMPNVAHYGCLVDLLGRAGQLEEALQIISNMPMKANSAVWGALLGACRAHGSLEIAEVAWKQLIELEPYDNAAYLLMCNIYAKCSKLEEAHKMREMIAVKGIRKEPGCSLVEMNGEVHEFVAGDKSHPRAGEIYSKLEEMSTELKLAGYVPGTSEIYLSMEEEGEDRANAISASTVRGWQLLLN